MIDTFMVQQEKEKAMHRVWTLEESMRVLWNKMQVTQAAVGVQIKEDFFNPSPALLSDMKQQIEQLQAQAFMIENEKNTLRVLKNTLSYMEA
ncbi:hypothetical protein SELR_pSRC400120 (plasmid) [Selenomonas ruminantium subsp. lactilytica TAM6421]|uniref:Uncharacterized protein n=1 Tax=Selenomonas ruminantium subsp. lactilytica (strain NBRC 103574 / TAM6421) TaxID=927704 RepID=I0GV76_SELRL|nr:hypothetical protein [Selenomonas ruminantium]BAL84663.1 hypothetical protein SELR_pSRC400120 [Selenomonas ruminantium subsp. lactilytica TAM6421]